METTIEIRKILASEQLSLEQSSICDIPFLLYEYFSSKRIGESKITKVGEETNYWCELLARQPEKGRVVAIYTEQKDGDAVETKFALSSWPPKEEEYRESYEFEIAGVLISGGWSYHEGNRFKESLRYRTRNSLYDLQVYHSMTVYVADALVQAALFMEDSKFVQRQFVDNNPNPPR